ncbi:hypothetical protein EJ08DRAFT_703323 [Tothia fuscella]|uniref:Uncharacterized protein n=1 Tax=Tothia fuscella TaxID=1048955 RepID=A0A9P4TSB0_9PEZI|nr:hypothetical protein EJ08DRAFT_703323 [Tothia fuscella]
MRFEGATGPPSQIRDFLKCCPLLQEVELFWLDWVSVSPEGRSYAQAVTKDFLSNAIIPDLKAFKLRNVWASYHDFLTFLGTHATHLIELTLRHVKFGDIRIWPTLFQALADGLDLRRVTVSEITNYEMVAVWEGPLIMEGDVKAKLQQAADTMCFMSRQEWYAEKMKRLGNEGYTTTEDVLGDEDMEEEVSEEEVSEEEVSEEEVSGRRTDRRIIVRGMDC